MPRMILLRTLLALGAARYSRAYGFSTSKIETTYYTYFDLPPEVTPPESEDEDELEPVETGSNKCLDPTTCAKDPAEAQSDPLGTTRAKD